jgi:hypothetical protein
MYEMFEVGGEVVPPHTAMGNTTKITSTWDLVELLFGWDDTQLESQRGWQKKTYRLIFHKTYDTIMAKLGEGTAQRWYNQFLATIILTHWVLPYATATAFLPLSKTNKKKGMKGRMIWFSTILQEPPVFHPPGRLVNVPRTLADITTAIRQGAGRGWQWHSADLIQEYTNNGLSLDAQGLGYFKLGSGQDGTTLLPMWEHGKPLPLQMVLDIHQKTLDQLEEYMQRELGAAEEEAC